MAKTTHPWGAGQWVVKMNRVLMLIVAVLLFAS